MPVTRSTQVRMACGGTMRASRGRHCRSNMAFSSCGGPGSSMTTAPDSSTHWPGRGAAVVGQNVGALDDERLALVDLRHFALHLREAPLQGCGDFGVENQLAVERLRHGFARDIVFGGPQPAGEDHDRRARERGATASARRSRSSPITHLATTSTPSLFSSPVR